MFNWLVKLATKPYFGGLAETGRRGISLQNGGSDAGSGLPAVALYELTDLTDDIAEFRARVELARLNHLRETIHNSSHKHAAVLIENLFLSAEDHVRVVCRTLNRDVYATPGVIAAADSFLQRPGSQMEILVADPNVALSPDHAFLKALEGYENFSVNVLGLDDPGFDFIVVDACAFRMETNPLEPIARASFNRPDVAKALVGMFRSSLPPERVAA